MQTFQLERSKREHMRFMYIMEQHLQFFSVHVENKPMVQWAFGAVAKMSLEMPVSQIQVPESMSQLHF